MEKRWALIVHRIIPVVGFVSIPGGAITGLMAHQNADFAILGFAAFLGFAFICMILDGICSSVYRDTWDNGGCMGDCD